jgi:hypothetical protein
VCICFAVVVPDPHISVCLVGFGISTVCQSEMQGNKFCVSLSKTCLQTLEMLKHVFSMECMGKIQA